MATPGAPYPAHVAAASLQTPLAAAPAAPAAAAWQTAAAMTAAQVRERPEAVALRYLDAERSVGHLTFSQIWCLARGVAALLRSAVADAASRAVPEDASALTLPVLVVAIDDGPYLPVAELGGFLAGCCLTPVDPHDPVARLTGVLEEIPTLAAIVTKDWGDSRKLGEVAAALRSSHGALLVLDLSGELPLSAVPASLLGDDAFRDAPGLAAAPDDVAYLWYTSGSTGRPKGCLIPHRAFSNWCRVKNPAHGIDHNSVVLVASASTFDPSIGDIFATWADGGCIAVVPRMLLFAHLGWVIQRLAATHLTCTPSLWASFEDGRPGHPDIGSLRAICLGGERMGPDLVDLWAGAFGVRLLNTYGTTECTVWQTLHEMRPGDSVGSVGHCLPGNEIRVVARDEDPEAQARPPRLAADGEAGELWQGGVQVGLGYFRRPERSAAAFLQPPGPGWEGAWYRTGDGGMMDATRGIQVTGRFDTQVKIRGMRVELGDIEQAVVRAGARHLVRACCAALRAGEVHAFVQLEAETADMLLGEAVEAGEHGLVTEFLLQGAARLLPRHMLPSRFVLLRKLPLGRTGKIDRKSLPEASCAVRLDRTNHLGSLTKLERAIADIWGEVLGIEGARLGPQDHFLALGGNSVAILRVSRRLAAAAKAKGATVDPDGPVAFALAPERLIHSPRLHQYSHVLEKSGVAHYFLEPGADAGAEEGVGAAPHEPAGEVEQEEREAASELRINYTKLLVTERRSRGEQTHGRAMDDQQLQELDHGAWEQVPLSTPAEMLFRAATLGVTGIVAVLMEGENVDVEGDVPLAELPPKGAEAKGLAPHRRLGLTPLHVAVAGGHDATVKLLLEMRADSNRMDYKGCPPLHKAAERGSRAAVELLLEARADLLVPDKARRFTALHAASKAGNLGAVEALIEAARVADSEFRCDEAVYVNILDRWKRAPLHWTILNAHGCCAERLVRAGATLRGSAGDVGKLSVFSCAGAAAAAAAAAKRKEDVEDPWALAVERFGEGGGPFREILSPAAGFVGAGGADLEDVKNDAT